jgi:hypothetical protein
MMTMNPDSLLRILALCVLLAAAETLHGIVRTLWITPRIGKTLALRWSVVSGSLLALALCAWQVPDIGLRGDGAHLALGVALASWMAAFDVAIGRLLMRKAWHKIWPDFNPASGNYLLFGLVFLMLVPWMVSRALG